MFKPPSLTKRQKQIAYPLAALVGLYLLFLIAVNVFIKTGSLRSIINTKPEKLYVDYDTASTFWPGRVHVSHISVRGRDDNVEWLVLIDDADVVIGLSDLVKKRFHAERVRGNGVSFHLRQRLEKSAATPAKVATLPPIAGFSDPPLKGVPTLPPTEDENALWSVLLENVDATNLTELWIDAYRSVGHAHVQGGFSLQPLRSLSVGPAHVDIADGEVFVAKDLAITAVKGTVDCTIRPFNPHTADGAIILGSLTARAEVDGQLESTRFVNHYTEDEPHFDHGKGPLHSSIHVRDGALENGSTARAQVAGATVSMDDYVSTIDAVLTIDVSPAANGKSAGTAKAEGGATLSRKGFESSPIRASAIVVSGHVPDLELAHALKGAVYTLNLGRAEIPDVRMFTSYFDPKGAFQLGAGRGHATAHLELVPETSLAKGDASVEVTALGFRVQKTVGQADSTLRVTLSAKDYLKALDFSGSSLDLKDVEIAQEGPHPAWWGHVDLADTHLGLAGGPSFHSVLSGRCRDGRPILAVLKAEVPAWVRGLTSLDGLTSSAVLQIAPKDASVSAIHAQGGGYDFAGTYHVKSGQDHGLFLVQKNFLSLGIETKNGHTTFEPLFAAAWYQEHTRSVAPIN